MKKFEFNPKTPPHIILKKRFTTWKETRELLVDTLELKTDNQSLEDLLDNNPENEYVGVEIDLLDITGTIYTKAVLSIEGQE